MVDKMKNAHDGSHALACLDCLEKIALSLEVLACDRGPSDDDVRANIEALAGEVRLVLMQLGCVPKQLLGFKVVDSAGRREPVVFEDDECEYAAQVAENRHASYGRSFIVIRLSDDEIMYSSRGPVD